MGGLPVGHAGGHCGRVGLFGGCLKDANDQAIHRINWPATEPSPGMLVNEDRLPFRIVSGQMSSGGNGELIAEGKPEEHNSQPRRIFSPVIKSQRCNLSSKLKVREGIRCEMARGQVKLFVYSTLPNLAPEVLLRGDDPYCGATLFLNCRELLAAASDMSRSNKVALPIYEKSTADAVTHLKQIGVVYITTNEREKSAPPIDYCLNRGGLQFCTADEQNSNGNGDDFPHGFIPAIQCAPLYQE